MQLPYCNILAYQRAKGERAWDERKTGEKWEESKREGGGGREEKKSLCKHFSNSVRPRTGEQ